MFKEILDKLSISSKEAVVDGNLNSFDTFKAYLHIDRYVEKKFEEIVLSAIASDKSQLILISGNVGDGKSHMLSRLFKNYPQEMEAVKVRNDATESTDVNKTWINELDEFLAPFSDDELNQEVPKTTRIVAINLGILSTFLNVCEGNFNELRKFVTDNGIIDKVSFNNKFNSKGHFQYINLADYNLFTLTENHASAVLIKSLLTKITAPVTENPFYKAFNEYYLSHPNTNACPMRFNYLQLAKPNVKDGIANLLVYAIIKFKLIVSVRDLLNFFYDLIVPNDYSNLSGAQIKELFETSRPASGIQQIIYNKLFESAGRSEIFDALKLIDPIRYRSAGLDEIIFKVSSTEKPAKIFQEYTLDFNYNWIPSDNDPKHKPELVKTFVRSLFTNNIEFFDHELKHYYCYTKYLFYYYKGDKDGLVPLYKEVIKAIYYWNGNSKQDKEVNVPIGKKQLEYNITQNITIRPDILLGNQAREMVEVNEFGTNLMIGIKAESFDISFKLDIDLYVLLQNVIKGYSPNKLDRENHTNFQQAVDRLTILSGQNKPINFEKVGGSIKEKYQLNYDQDFGYDFNKV
jgi:DNA phosphorothioation-dependent restriction protein DptF